MKKILVTITLLLLAIIFFSPTQVLAQLSGGNCNANGYNFTVDPLEYELGPAGNITFRLTSLANPLDDNEDYWIEFFMALQSNPESIQRYSGAYINSLFFPDSGNDVIFTVPIEADYDPITRTPRVEFQKTGGDDACELGDYPFLDPTWPIITCTGVTTNPAAPYINSDFDLTITGMTPNIDAYLYFEPESVPPYTFGFEVETTDANGDATWRIRSANSEGRYRVIVTDVHSDILCGGTGQDGNVYWEVFVCAAPGCTAPTPIPTPPGGTTGPGTCSCNDTTTPPTCLNVAGNPSFDQCNSGYISSCRADQYDNCTDCNCIFSISGCACPGWVPPGACSAYPWVDTAIGCLPSFPPLFISTVRNILLASAGGIALILMIAGAAFVLTSQGNPERIKRGKEVFTAGVIGILVSIFSLFLLRLIFEDILNIF